jgi:hypothetical protein
LTTTAFGGMTLDDDVTDDDDAFDDVETVSERGTHCVRERNDRRSTIKR